MNILFLCRGDPCGRPCLERSLIMIDNLMIGLKITGLGMGIVFAILIVLYMAIKILGRFAK